MNAKVKVSRRFTNESVNCSLEFKVKNFFFDLNFDVSLFSFLSFSNKKLLSMPHQFFILFPVCRRKMSSRVCIPQDSTDSNLDVPVLEALQRRK